MDRNGRRGQIFVGERGEKKFLRKLRSENLGEKFIGEGENWIMRGWTIERNILSRSMCDYRWGFNWILDLLTTYIS
jgi:hypothetical protein